MPNLLTETVFMILRDNQDDNRVAADRATKRLNLMKAKTILLEERVWRSCPVLMSEIRHDVLPNYWGPHLLPVLWGPEETPQTVGALVNNLFKRGSIPGPQIIYCDGLESLPFSGYEMVRMQRSFVKDFAALVQANQSGPLVWSSSVRETIYEQNCVGQTDQGPLGVEEFLDHMGEKLSHLMGTGIFPDYTRYDLGWLIGFNRPDFPSPECWEIEEIWKMGRQLGAGITYQLTYKQLADPNTPDEQFELIGALETVRRLV